MKCKILFILFFLPCWINAHPHVFIDGDVKVIFDKNGLAGFQVNWVFDIMFSDMMIRDFDMNRDDKFNQGEQKTLKTESFNNLKEFNYFILININSKKFDVKFAKDFKALIKKGKMIYSFFVPCHIKSIKTDKVVSFAMYDKSYYTAITLKKKDPVKFLNTSGIKYSYKIFDHYKKSTYFGQKPPQEIIIKFRK